VTWGLWRVKDLDGRSSGRSRLPACREASDSDFSENAQNLNQGRCKRCKQLGYISLLREEYYNESQSSHLCLQLRRGAESRLCIDEHCKRIISLTCVSIFVLQHKLSTLRKLFDYTIGVRLSASETACEGLYWRTTQVRSY
jgi:hypothetical protein